MQEEIVDIVLAKRLKRYSYSEPCTHYWLDKEDVPYVPKGLHYSRNLINHNEFDDFIYSAPTVKDAKKFLNGINVEVMILSEGCRFKAKSCAERQGIFIDTDYTVLGFEYNGTHCFIIEDSLGQVRAYDRDLFW